MLIGLKVFIGQIMGTSVGSRVFLQYGWRPAAALSVAWSAFSLLVLFVRGPHCRRYTWFGYEGGCNVRKHPVLDVEKPESVGSAETTESAYEHDIKPLQGSS